MHISLSDLLTCPRCGPEWGLVLLPGAVRERRVETGALGCPGCETRYGIDEGVARLAIGEGIEAGGTWRAEGGAARLAALLGLGERRGVVLLAGPAAAHGPGLAGLVEGVEVVVVGPAGWFDGAGGPMREEAAGEARGPVTRLEVGRRIPLRTGVTGGVALTGGAVALAEEGARVLGPGARILLDPVDDAAREALTGAGLRVLAEEGGALVATR